MSAEQSNACYRSRRMQQLDEYEQLIREIACRPVITDEDRRLHNRRLARARELAAQMEAQS